MRKICPTCKQSINPDSVAKHIFHSVETVETPEERKHRLSDHWSELG